MRNDTTILRFRFHEGRDEALSLAAVNAVAQAVEREFNRLAPLFKVDTSAQMLCVASPRRGSIEFHFKVVFRVAPDRKKGRKARAGTASTTDKIVAATAVAGLLWLVVFGENGVVDLVGRLKPRSDPAAVAGLLTTSLRDHSLSKSAALRVFDVARPGLEQISNLAAGSGADEVEIQLPGERAINLYTFPGWPDFVHPQFEPSVQTIAFERVEDELLSLDYRGRILNAFFVVDLITRYPVLLVWPYATPLPPVGFVGGASVVAGPGVQVTAPNGQSASTYTVLQITRHVE